MTARILVAGIWHETNTFSTVPTDLEAFRRYQFAEGRDVLDRSEATNTEIGGFMAEASDLGFDLMPALFAGAVPSGVVTAAALEQIVKTASRRARERGRLDGALIALHGAMVAEGRPHAEAHYLSRLRALLGPKCPMVATFDSHANLSETLVDACDVLVGYETYPHVDMAERGREAARILSRLIETGEPPRKAFRKLPLLWPPLLQITSSPPMSEVMALLKEVKATPGIVSASVAAGFPWADVAHLGASTLVYGSEENLVERAADSLAEALWSRRHARAPDLVPVDEAVSRAMASTRGPVVLVDAADNVGGGAPGDGTVVLSALLRAKARSAVVVVHDPAAVEAAAGAGLGARFDGLVGGKSDDRHGPPARLEGEIAFLGNVEYRRDGTYMTGQTVRLGTLAVVEAGGVRVVLTEKPVMPFDTTHLRAVGIEPERQHIIVVKSAIAWQSAFGSMAASHIVLDTPGICAVDVTRFAYTRRQTKLFPLDRDAAWPEGN